MALVLVTPPTAEPVSLAEAKEHLRIEHAEDDGYIGALVTAARAHVESWTGRALVTQTWDLVRDEFPEDVLELAKGKVQSITSLTYVDAAGVQQTLAQTAYQVDLDAEFARLAPLAGASWPPTAARLGAVRVRFVAGYGAAAAVPQPIKQAMLLLVGHLYEHRESEIAGVTTAPWRFAVESLLSPYRLRWVA